VPLTLLAVWGLLAAAPGASPSSTEAPVQPVPQAVPPVLALPATTRPVRRLAAITLGVERNQRLLAERLERERAQRAYAAAWSPWSPTLKASSFYRHATDPVPTHDRLDYALGAGWETVVGTHLEASVGVDHGLDGPPHQPQVSLSLSQPLLKGGGLAGAALPLTEAQLTAQLQAELYRAALDELIVQVDAAYWELALAQADLDIRTRSEQRAESQYRDTRENIRRGILADAEIHVVEENLVIFQQEHLRARERLFLSRRGLSELLFLAPDEAFAAEDAFDVSGVSLPSAAEAVERALRENPTVCGQRLRVELARSRVQHQQNQVLPSLSLESSLGLRHPEDEYGAAFGGLARDPALDARLGLRLEVPLDRDAVSAGLEAADAALRKATAELAQAENRLRFEVENALTSLTSTLALSQSSARQVELAELKLAAQMDKYRNGLSTLNDVVRFQRELDEALIAARRVARDVRTGQARLLRAIGTLHVAVGVEVN
jgi:outer membrane protein